MMKILFSFFLMCFAQVSQAGAFPKLSPSEVIQMQESYEAFQTKLGKKQIQIGRDVFDVDGPDDFIRTKKGIYFTGRLRLYRWRFRFLDLLEKYTWDHRIGEFFFTARECIFWDERNEAWVLAFVSKFRPIDDFYKFRGKTNLELYGEEPPWDRFRGLERRHYGND